MSVWDTKGDDTLKFELGTRKFICLLQKRGHPFMLRFTTTDTDSINIFELIYWFKVAIRPI